MKSVPIRRLSGPYFPAFRIDVETYGVYEQFLRSAMVDTKTVHSCHLWLIMKESNAQNTEKLDV